MALKKCRLCYFPVAFCGKILQYLLSFIFWKGAVDKNKNLNTDTAALKGSRRTKYIPKIQGQIVLPNFIPADRLGQSGEKGVYMETQRSPGVPLLLLTGWSLDQS